MRFQKSNKKRKFQKEEPFFVNEAIRARKVRCIDANEENLGVIETSEAIRKAQEQELDLVQVSKSGDIPACKILDYQKFKYEHQKKQKAAAKKQRESVIKLKEIKLRPTTEENDLKVKAKAVQGFIDDGHRVKISIILKGRQLSHKDLAVEQMNTFVAMVANVNYIDQPNITGRVINATIIKAENDNNGREAAQKTV